MRIIIKRETVINAVILLIVLLIYLCKPLIIANKSLDVSLIRFYTSYAHDFLAGVAIISYINLLLVLFSYPSITSLTVMLTITLLCGIIWEFFAPYLKENSVTDLYDIAAYCLGAMFYYFVIRQIIKKGI